MAIYKQYDKAALDDQYNNRSKEPNFANIVQDWEERSQRLREQAPYHADLSYGSHERERLDIFPASQPPAPFHVFFHGGYWQALSRDVFHVIAEGFTGQHVTPAFVNYPLGPQASMDEIVTACRNSLAWLYEHGAEYGGDPQKIYISGHSAGGHLVAMLMATDWPAWKPGLPRDLIKGGCAISGLFDLIPIQLSYVNDKLGMDEAMARRNSPVRLAPGCNSPLIVAVGERESAEYHAQSHELAAAWAQYGLPITELVLPAANHFTVLEHLTAPGAGINQAILVQMEL